MTETINWATLPNKDKTRLIITDVLHWPCFDNFNTSLSSGRSFPLAIWQGDHWRVYPEHDGCPYPFDPLHNMNDAWLVLDKMKNTEQWGTFCFELDELLTHHQLNWNLAQKGQYITWFEQFLAALNAEAICVTALKAVGYHIEMETR